MATPNIVPIVNGQGGIGTAAKGWGGLFITNTTTSSSTQGGTLILAADDGAVMGDNHRLGVLEFKAAEDTGNTLSIGARIQAVARDAWDGSNNDADLEFYTTNGTTESKVLTLDSDKLATFTGQILSRNTTTSSATEGGVLRLTSDDGAALGDDHRLGVINFQAAEDGSSTLRNGASIEAYADAAWSDTVNDTRLEFYTKDGDNNSELSLTLDSDLLATFAGDIQVGGGDVFGPTDGDFNIASDGNMTFNIDNDDDETTQSFTFKNDAIDCLAITETGVLTSAGAIGGINYRTIYVDAGSMVPTNTNGAQAGTNELSTNDVMLVHLAFDKDTDEKAQFKMVMPEQWDHGTIKAKFYWAPPNTDTGNVVWAIQANSLSHEESMDDTWGTAVAADADTASGTRDDLHITAATTEITVAGTPSEGKLVMFQIYRDTSADTFAGDAKLTGVNIQYKERSAASEEWV